MYDTRMWRLQEIVEFNEEGSAYSEICFKAGNNKVFVGNKNGKVVIYDIAYSPKIV